MQQVTLGRIQNPVRGLLHGSAALVSVVGVVALVARSSGYRIAVASVVYGLTLVGMYATSALYHTVPWEPVWKSRLQILDHTFIYALVAGTFTPLVVGVGRGGWVILGLASAWGLVALGLGGKLVHGRARRRFLQLQFLAVGLALPPLWVTLVGMDTTSAFLTVAGGIAYLLAVLLFVNGRPRLVPGVFSHHEFFHVMVIIASVTHFLAVWRVVSAA